MMDNPFTEKKKVRDGTYCDESNKTTTTTSSQSICESNKRDVSDKRMSSKKCNERKYAGDDASRKSLAVIKRARIFFVLCLMAVAGCLGYLSYYLLSEAENNLVKKQYKSTTTSAIINVQQLSENKLLHGTQIMAKHVGWAFPETDVWPFVWVPSYWDMMKEVLPTSVWSGVNLAPIVTPAQGPAFEDFAYQKFATKFGKNTTMGAKSHFGKGIWVIDEAVNTSDHRYHDTTGVPTYDGSPYVYLAPKIQDGLIYTPYTMMNVHGFRSQGLALDAVMNCTLERQRQLKTRNLEPQQTNPTTAMPLMFSGCSALSGMLPAKDIQDARNGIGGFIATPIYPANDPLVLVGFIFGIVYWLEVMMDMFPEDTSGIDCVFSEPNMAYTYTITNGTSKLICEGDCHNTEFDEFAMTADIIDPSLLSKGSIIYAVTCYPNEEFFKVYTTENPTKAAIGTVAIIMFTSMLFFLYDFFVRQEFTAKKELFDAKRKFVRFVSHEVRTPLNSVGIGLSILQEEAAAALEHETSSLLSLTNGGLGASKKANEKQHNGFGIEQIKRWFDLANEISSNAQASVDVLDDFLNYDKIAAGELLLEYTIVSAWNLIEETVLEFNLSAAKQKISLHIHSPDATELEITKLVDDLEVEGIPSRATCLVQDQKLVGDSVRITQVIRNLVSNAIKFSKEGGDIHISATFEKETTMKKHQTFDFILKNEKTVICTKTANLVFTIKDNGAGLSKSQLKKLFGDGVQFDVNELQAGKGSGLGLYIAKGIVEQHGGKLTADSEGIGHGTTFTMTLPIYNVPDDVLNAQHVCDRRGQSTEVIENSLTESEGKRAELLALKILLVDDSKSNRKLLDRLLSMRGHRCDQAEDGHIGVDMALEAEESGRPYDIIFMDYQMPTMCGPDAVSRIRDHRHDCEAFIIGLTGNIMDEDVSHFRACGANLVLPKPFKIAGFELLLRNKLKRNGRGRIVESSSLELIAVGL